MDLQAFVNAAARAFVDHADDERWTQLISAARNGDDPALAALSAILKAKLTPPAQPPKRGITVIARRAGRGPAPDFGEGEPAARA